MRGQRASADVWIGRAYMIAAAAASLWLVLMLSSTRGWAGMTYYVATDGDDGNPGTVARPWRTIQKAADTLTAGDTLYLRGGTYRGQVVPRNSGAPGKYITYAAYPGEPVTIDGEDGTQERWGWGVFHVVEREYIKALGLRVVNSASAGIYVRGSKHIVIEDNHTCNTGSSGIGVWHSYNVIVKGNEVERAVSGRGQECISIAGSDQVQVVSNHVHDGGPGRGGGEGIDAKDGASNVTIRGNHVHHTRRLGIYVDAWRSHTYNIEVVGNRVHDCGGCGFAAASERGGLLENVRFVNNIAYRNKSAGIAVAGWNGEYPHPMRNIQIVNNTVYDNGWDEHEWGGGICVESPDARNVVIRNNICSKNRDWQIRDQVGRGTAVIDHNLVDGYRGHPDETRGSDYREGDPLFADAAEGDFHLMAGSPAIDDGSSVGAPTEDAEGNPRPRGEMWDMGAYEFMGHSSSSREGGEGK